MPNKNYAAADVLQMLKEGNERFVSHNREYPNQGHHRRKETHAAQEPYATILTCSDSRVPAEHIFDAGLGDLFVVRVAGNICTTSTLATVEFGVSALHTPVVVVMGHTNCGAVDAALSNKDAVGCIPELLKEIRPATENTLTKFPDLEYADQLQQAVQLNVIHTIQQILERSVYLKEHVAAGNIKVIGAIYDLASGVINWFHEESPAS